MLKTFQGSFEAEQLQDSVIINSPDVGPGSRSNSDTPEIPREEAEEVQREGRTGKNKAGSHETHQSVFPRSGTPPGHVRD